MTRHGKRAAACGRCRHRGYFRRRGVAGVVSGVASSAARSTKLLMLRPSACAACRRRALSDSHNRIKRWAVFLVTESSLRLVCLAWARLYNGCLNTVKTAFVFYFVSTSGIQSRPWPPDRLVFRTFAQRTLTAARAASDVTTRALASPVPARPPARPVHVGQVSGVPQVLQVGFFMAWRP